MISMSLEIYYFNHDIFYLFTTFNKYLWDIYWGNLEISESQTNAIQTSKKIQYCGCFQT